MRLLELSISSFRGFGPKRTDIDLSADLVLLYGPNGYGKTSLAEAVEWLFYGNTLRRQRGEVYSKVEYAGSFANVHGNGTAEVSARVLWRGSEITLTRRLKANEMCETLVDGHTRAFSAIGLDPPAAAYPVVAQHALQFFIHRRPKDRRDAICEALGLDELVQLKSALESARASFQKTPPGQVLQARTALSQLLPGLRLIPSLEDLVRRWSKSTPSVDSDRDIIPLITAATELTGETYGDEISALNGLRLARQKAIAAVFDLSAIAFTEDYDAGMAALSETAAELKRGGEQLIRDVATAAAVSAAKYAAGLLTFWAEGLRIAPEGNTCPMCEADTLDTARRTMLASRIAESQTVIDAQKAVASSAAAFGARAKGLTIALAALGELSLASDGERTALQRLLPDHAGEVAALLAAHDTLATDRRAFSDFLAGAIRAAAEAPQKAARPAEMPGLVAALTASQDAIDASVTVLTDALHAYLGAWLILKPLLDGKVAENGLVARIDAVGMSLRDMRHVRILSRYEAILAESQTLIRALEEEIQRKQADLLVSRGKEVKDFHDLLHPGSDVGFDAMEPATDSMRLHARSFGKRMSAAATLSECQLNCLGLAMWLMRATAPGSPFGFVVLDDPVQAMDDVHAEAFLASVVPHLIQNRGKQVILLSHVGRITDRLRDLNAHRLLGHYHFDTYTPQGPAIVLQERRRQLLAEIKYSANGGGRFREQAVMNLRKLAESVIREAYRLKTGTPAPSAYDMSQPKDLLRLFTQVPGVEPSEHAGMRDTINFCSPAHHEEVGYEVPTPERITPHINRIEEFMKRLKIT